MGERLSFAPFAVFAAGSALLLGASLGAGCATKVRAFGSGGGGQAATGSGGQPASSSTGGTGGVPSSSSAGGSGGQGTGGLPPAVSCNPITSAECDATMGEACDWNGNDFVCFPPINDVPLCMPCGAGNPNGDYCLPGMTCLPTSVCAAYCCADTDCPGGLCDNSMFGGLPVGVCVFPDPDGGAPAPVCMLQFPVPSMGGCYTPP